MPDDMDIQDRMYACFGGYEDRDCASCPAYFDRKGPCCYGDQSKFDPEDDSKNGCQECPHFDNCAEDCGYELVEEEEEEQAPTRFSSYTTPFQQQQKKQTGKITIRGGAPAQTVRTTYTPPVGPSPSATYTPPSVYGPTSPNVPARRQQMTVGQLAAVGQQYGRSSNPEVFFKKSIWGSLRGFFAAGLHFFDTHYWD
jgi:hypothetical protein